MLCDVTQYVPPAPYFRRFLHPTSYILLSKVLNKVLTPTVAPSRSGPNWLPYSATDGRANPGSQAHSSFTAESISDRVINRIASHLTSLTGPFIFMAEILSDVLSFQEGQTRSGLSTPCLPPDSCPGPGPGPVRASTYQGTQHPRNGYCNVKVHSSVFPPRGLGLPGSLLILRTSARTHVVLSCRGCRGCCVTQHNTAHDMCYVTSPQFSRIVLMSLLYSSDDAVCTR